MGNDIPEELLDLLRGLVAEQAKEESEETEDLEYLYDYAYNYSDYPEKDNHDDKSDEWSTVIKISL